MPDGEGVAHDAEYQKMVQDVTDSQSGVKGWLFAAGAFDKGDQLYLKSEEERLRFVEQELEENERRAVSTGANVAAAGELSGKTVVAAHVTAPLMAGWPVALV